MGRLKRQMAEMCVKAVLAVADLPRRDVNLELIKVREWRHKSEARALKRLIECEIAGMHKGRCVRPTRSCCPGA